jgi:hypothetical protein
MVVRTNRRQQHMRGHVYMACRKCKAVSEAVEPGRACARLSSKNRSRAVATLLAYARMFRLQYFRCVITLPVLNTYRTICIGPRADFIHLLPQVRELRRDGYRVCDQAVGCLESTLTGHCGSSPWNSQLDGQRLRRDRLGEGPESAPSPSLRCECVRTSVPTRP